jgi:hypothetical protein
MVDDSLVARAIKTAPFPAKARADVFIEPKSPDRLSVGRADFEGSGMYDDGQGLPFAFLDPMTVYRSYGISGPDEE